jgi:small-conductance mechanosensitive channel/CRP-like cAMP-binding protein
MTGPIWVDAETIADAALFAGLAALLAVASLPAPKSRRRGMVALAVLAAAALAGLWALGTYGVRLGSGVPYDVLRETLLGVLAIAVIRSAVLFVLRILMGRFRVPHIMVDMLFMLGMIAYAIYRLNAVGVNLAGIVTTSAIVTGALAFSAGETLGNLWAGLSLQIENTLRIGDWVRIGEKVGQVVSIRWRSMAIATPANETIVVPNSMLMKDRIVVLGRAGEAEALYRRTVPFSVDYDYAPARVIAVITEALRRAEIPNVARTPAPYCVVREFAESGVLYAAVYFPVDIATLMEADSDVMVSVYAALQRQNMPIPLPQQVVEIKRPSRMREAQAAEHKARIEVLEQLELFGVLVDAERQAVAAELRRLLFAAHDTVFRKGESADSLYILARGRVRIVEQDSEGHRMELAELTAPAYFGEMGLLTGQPRGATVVAEEDLVCYQLGKAGFDEILKARPEIAESLAHVLSMRQAENDAKLRALDEEARARHALGGAREIVRRIRRFFGLPGA